MSEQLTPNLKEQYSEGNMPEGRESTTPTIESDNDSATRGQRNKRTARASTTSESLEELTLRLHRIEEESRRDRETIHSLVKQLTERQSKYRKPREDSDEEDDDSEIENKHYRTASDLAGLPPELQHQILEAEAEGFYDESMASAVAEKNSAVLDKVRKSIKELKSALKDADTKEKLIALLEGDVTTAFNVVDGLLSGANKEQKKQRKPRRTRPQVSESQRKKDFEARKKLINATINERKDLNDAKDQAYRTLEYLNQLGESAEAQKIDVKCIEDLATLIIQTDPELWKERFPLLDDNGNINQGNFLEWIRESMLWHDDNDADNQINLWSLIELSTPYRSFNLGGMLRNKGKFFRTRDGQDLDELRETITREVWLFNTSRNDDLKYKLQMSSDKGMSDILKEMYYVNTFTKNAFGKSTMRWIMTMPEKFKPPYAQRTQFDQPSTHADANVGEGVRTAFLLYYHISDHEQLEKLLGKDKSLLNREKYEEYIKEKELEALKKKFIAEGKDVRSEEDLEKIGLKPDSSEYVDALKKRRDQLKKIFEKTDEKTKGPSQEAARKIREEIEGRWLGSTESGKKYTLDKIFDKNGDIIPEGFIDFVNIFTGPETNSQNIAAVRALIKGSIEELYPEKSKQGLTIKQYKDLINKTNNDEEKKRLTEELKEFENKSSRKESFGMVNYAERWAYSMLRWSGAAARNDTGARSYDKWTELQLTKYKRLRDSHETRVSAYGNPKNINLYKMLAPDLMTGLVLQEDKKISPYALLMEIEKERREFEKLGKADKFDIHKRLEKLEFTANAMGQFAAVQLANAVSILEILTEAKELDFDKLFSVDKYGRVTIDEAAMQEELKKFFKVFRNAYSTWSQINFDTKVRVMVANGDPPTYKDKSIAEAMFGDEILKIPQFLDADGNFSSEQMMSGVHNGIKFNHRNLLWKQLVKGFIAAQIQAHRDLSSHYTQYDFFQTEAVYEILEKIPGKILHTTDTYEGHKKNKKLAKVLKRNKRIREIKLKFGLISQEEAKKQEEDDEKLLESPPEERERTIKEIQTVGHAFSHSDIDWIRSHSGTEKKWMDTREVIGSLFSGGWDGLKDLGKLLFGEASK